MIDILGFGSGGHAKSVLDILQGNSEYVFRALLDCNSELWGKTLAGVPILGGDDLLDKLWSEGIHHAFVGVGSTGTSARRQKLYELAIGRGFQVVSAIHPQAIIARSARVGTGVAIMAGAILNADAQIGDNVIINTGSVIEHDCFVGDHTHIATGALLAGDVRVGQGSHVGIGASVRQGVRIGSHTIVGAGAVVVKDVPDNVVVVGVPARFLKAVTS